MTTGFGSPFTVVHPETSPIPLILSSPHSGQIYPPCLLRETRLSITELRRLEDAWVDRLFDAAPTLGAPLLQARFARAYVDANREAFELDAGLFGEPLPKYVNADSPKARAGLGSIPSRIAGQPIYRSTLSLDRVERRIELAYWPYHRALQGLIDQARARFGQVLLIDCHSMPSLTVYGLAGGALGSGPVDFALGDRFGKSCDASIVDRAERLLRARGYRVGRNRPYAGGHITEHYGRPDTGVHALQLEIRRSLYMDEGSLRLHPSLAALRALLGDLITSLGTLMQDLGTSLETTLLRPLALPAGERG
jgi:N-formylglutamate amidohydrolase